MAIDLNDVREALKKNRKRLHSKPNVLATGIGFRFVNGKRTDDLAIVCSVDTKVAKHRLLEKEIIPQSIDGIRTDVQPLGPFYAFQNHTARMRPAPGGVSIGHTNVTAGTLGCLVQSEGKVYILSNNHVLANSNEAQIGDSILQPGAYDGGSFPDDFIARLSNFIPIRFESEEEEQPCAIGSTIGEFLNGFAIILGSRTRLVPTRINRIDDMNAQNLVDCAIAEPINPNDVVNEILEIGKISGVAEAELGMAVKKSGRTTGLTTGSIEQIDVTVKVSYGENKTAVFVDQLMAGSMSAGGDSGSAVLNEQNQIVGLLFAGSSTSTIINRIQNVFDALNVSLLE
ncbi:hypothetical protein DRI50_01345 [candidate division KSB1 bacterium]|nr:MAG: hypothetical protein DRI50_01345 [candidate division KSB1 bacterium]